MVSNSAVVVTERLCGDHHFLKRAATVGPGRVTVQVTLDGGAHAQSALDKRLLLRTQLLQVLGHLTIHGLDDHRGGLGSNATHLCPGALLLMVAALPFAQPIDDVGGTAVGAHSIGVGTRAFQQKADLPQCLYGIHSGRLLRGRALSRTVGIGGASITFSERLTIGGNLASRRSQADRKSQIYSELCAM